MQTIALKGAPMTLVNNTAAINKVVMEWNLTHGWPGAPGASSGETPTSSDSEASSGETGASGSETGNDPPLAAEPGCACNSQDASPLGLGLAALGLLALRRRRR